MLVSPWIVMLICSRIIEYVQLQWNKEATLYVQLIVWSFKRKL